MEDIWGKYVRCMSCGRHTGSGPEPPQQTVDPWRGVYHTKQKLNIPQSPFFNVQARPPDDKEAAAWALGVPQEMTL